MRRQGIEMIKNNQDQASKKVRAEIENAVDASEIKSPLSKIWKKLTVSERKQIALEFFDIADRALADAIHEAFEKSAQIEREACARIAETFPLRSRIQGHGNYCPEASRLREEITRRIRQRGEQK